MRIVPILLSLGLAVGSWVAPAAPPPVDNGSVSMVAAPAFSGVVRPGQSLQVTGTVTNSTSQDMDAGVATVHLDGTRVADRAALSNWLAESDDKASGALGSALGSAEIGELARGQSKPFTIVIPAETLALSGNATTVLPFAVKLQSGTVEVDLVKSALVWLPEGAAPAISLAVVSPLIAPAGTTGLLSSDELAALTAPGGLLDAQLRTASAHAITLGIDPMIIASIRLLGSSAPTSATAWLASLAAAPNQTFPLTWADADAALAARAGARSLLQPIRLPIDPTLFPPAVSATTSPEPTNTATPSPEPTVPTLDSLQEWDYTIDGIAWPLGNTVAAGSLEALSADGFTRTLLDSRQVEGANAGSPNVVIDDGDAKGLVATTADAEVSRLLRLASDSLNDVDSSAALAALAAHLALAATTLHGSTLVATLDRDGSASGPRLAETLNALDTLPWVTESGLDEVLERPGAAATFVPSTASDDRAATVKALLGAERAVTAFASVVEDPTLVTGPRRLALLGLLAPAWSFDAAGWATATTADLATSTAILGSVHIPESSMINFPLEKGNLPITVRNDLAYPVTVFVTVQPARAILDVLDDRVELRIEANSQAKAQIPVQSIANGEVRTMVTLASPTGVAISTPSYVDLNVQAGWETAATVVLAIIVIGLFGAGVARTILRRRRLRRERVAAATGDEKADESGDESADPDPKATA